MTSSDRRLPFALQLLASAVIVAVLAGAAHVMSSEEHARRFDEAAEETLIEWERAEPDLEGSARDGEPSS